VLTGRWTGAAAVLTGRWAGPAAVLTGRWPGTAATMRPSGRTGSTAPVGPGSWPRATDARCRSWSGAAAAVRPRCWPGPAAAVRSRSGSGPRTGTRTPWRSVRDTQTQAGRRKAKRVSNATNRSSDCHPRGQLFKAHFDYLIGNLTKLAREFPVPRRRNQLRLRRSLCSA
jgi:hypothetical protein